MTTIERLKDLERRVTNLVTTIHEQNLKEEPGKLEPKRYTMKDACQLIGRTYPAVREAEQSGKLPQPEMGPNGRRLGYTLADINRAREHFGTRLRRGQEDPVIRLAFTNFKGGSAKTTTAVHTAQYLAEAGLKVLLIDCDPQASATATFGYAPDDDIEPEQTLLPYLEKTAPSLHYAVRQTYWDSLDLIPANLALYNAEYLMAAEASSVTMQRLRAGLESVQDEYDVLIIDPPPALGMISLSVMHTANAMIVPTPAASYDLNSTRAFLSMMVDVAQTLEQHGLSIDYQFIKLLVTRLDENSESQSQLADLLPDVLGSHMLRHFVRKTAALDRAGVHGRTIYEMSPQDVPRRTWQRAMSHFNKVNEEILTLIRSCWPSHANRLRAEASL